MKNVQIIDGAENCAYSVFQFTDAEFALIFPAPGQDVEFIEDVLDRDKNNAAGDALRKSWDRELSKPQVDGIHGTLFYELLNKKKYYPNKKESDIVNNLYKP